MQPGLLCYCRRLLHDRAGEPAAPAGGAAHQPVPVLPQRCPGQGAAGLDARRRRREVLGLAHHRHGGGEQEEAERECLKIGGRFEFDLYRSKAC